MNDLIDQLNWGIIGPLLVLQLLLLIVALTDCLRAKRTNGPRWLWILVIILVNTIGPILYFVLGRSRDR
ncbi:PLD nuclease N-terminal domain-containing protein [Paenibacillus koleovorans]|uniref:PLD nuclease N-terminal domain-containing protein n=1 Tax=Paenibacillus koleovorans TaxID=121608 RepID=UPI0015806576|nr:PLD nuclease N-terminal domain-containing protein [Paenibacillus koleovorans]